MHKQKNNNGITLIALIVTIIVLLVLAGISIIIVSGSNGVLTKVIEAKKASKEGKNEDTRRLLSIEAAMNLNETMHTEIIEGKEVNVNIPSGIIESSIEEERNIRTGLVAIDLNGNEWVWIEVPKSIYQTGSEFIPTGYSSPSNLLDTTNIEAILNKYTEFYNSKGESTDGDHWYGWNDANGNGTIQQGEIITKAMADEDESLKSNNAGCGLTYDEYYLLKNKMLSSVYDKGGFWIGRYEAGTNTIRSNKEDPLTIVLSQKNKYPYNYITVCQAQNLASKINPSNMTTSSLMFGVQWNLVCKFMEKNAIELGGSDTVRQSKIKTDSSDWGNYFDSSFTVDRGKYLINGEWKNYYELQNCLKDENKSRLLTTGASDRNCTLNIYDFAGNLSEWTLQHNIMSTKPCTSHGGAYVSKGKNVVSNFTACSHYSYYPTESSHLRGFRVTLY